VNGKWLDTVHIPETESGIGAFDDLYNKTRDHLHEILDSVSKLNGTAEVLNKKSGISMLQEWILPPLRNGL
jgi:putative endopeptidase